MGAQTPTPTGETQQLQQRGEGAPTTITIDPTTRAALATAMSEALDLGHDYLGTEHLLLGILNHPDTLAGQVLTSAGVTLDAARDTVRQLLEQIIRERTG
ncbi:Clp protease N-terminal domain-containing protein [Kineococcus sp. SYSU DK006]|uniref:Clp protease N-terminal domain-containing protein n=1 Tax=Kineococcus sp. SYSU DK006 TaxID=3383127 RepID=UPI003D7C75FC